GSWVCSQLGMLADVAYHASRHTDHDGEVGHVARYHRACADQCGRAYGHATEDGGVGAYGGRALHQRALDLPVRFALHRAVASRRARIAIVDEHDAVPDEHCVLDHHAFADEAVRRNLAARADDGVLLDLNEGPH